jgi:hypothetical protein
MLPSIGALVKRLFPRLKWLATLVGVADAVGGRFDVAGMLAAVEDAPAAAAADVAAELLGEAINADEVAFLVPDFGGDALVRLGHTRSAATTRSQGEDTAQRVPLTGAHGRALVSQQTQVEHSGEQCRLVAPVTNRGDAVGVLELLVPEPPDEHCLADVALAAHTLAYVVIANRRFTDLFTWAQRSDPLTLAAEIQHRLLPAVRTCEAGQFSVAAWL